MRFSHLPGPPSTGVAGPVLGIDPGLTCTGYGILQRSGREVRMVTCGTIAPPPAAGFFGGLERIKKGLDQLIREYEPAEVAVEEVFYHRNARSALLLGHARGVAIASALDASLPVFQYTALQVKKAVVGYGRAEKSQVQAMLKVLLKLAEEPRPADAADALAVALTHVHWIGPGRR